MFALEKYKSFFDLKESLDILFSDNELLHTDTKVVDEANSDEFLQRIKILKKTRCYIDSSKRNVVIELKSNGQLFREMYNYN